MAAYVAEGGYFPKTGFLATPVRLPVLTESGHNDVAGKLALQESDRPSRTARLGGMN